MHRKPSRISRRTKILAFLTALVVGVLGFALSASAAAKPSVGLDANGTIHVCVQTAAPHNWAANTNSANWASNTCPSGYTQLHFTPGAGNAAKPTATTSSTLTNRNDSGNHGDWAVDTLSRVAIVTVDHQVPVGNCGPVAQCFFVTGTVADSGSFKTISGALSPEAGTPISGQLTGTVVGGSNFEFYASSNDVLASRVDPVQSGAAHTTNAWLEQFFPAGTVFSTVAEPQWSWTYTASSTCEKWVNAVTGDSGDITGSNHCAA
jgi:hypothetical protein